MAIYSSRFTVHAVKGDKTHSNISERINMYMTYLYLERVMGQTVYKE